MSVRLADLDRACFQGVVPSVIATCSLAGEPNVTYLSQVHYLDQRHVALSCQFFNKTKRNVSENPYASVLLYHPVSFECWRLRLRLDHIETSGPLFDTMADRIQVIASHTGMSGVFRLISADVYQVLAVEPMPEFLLPADPLLEPEAPDLLTAGPLTEIRGLQVISERIARARDLESLLARTLTTLDELFGFAHARVLLHEEACGKLVAIASHGYANEGVGAEVALGDGLIGTVARERRMVRIAGVPADLRYARAVRSRLCEAGDAERLAPEIPLPGLADAQAQLALPLLVADRLVGVLAVESRDPLAFDEWDEAFLQIVGNQIAMGIDRMQEDDDEPGEAREPGAPAGETIARAAAAPGRNFVYYRNDDCIFVDGEYLVRNVPGKILWRVLRAFVERGQREFTNRELRLDPSLGLPAYRDNLESRLILLRKRLASKCPDVRLVPVRRGRFALEVDGAAQLVEKDSA